MSHSKNTIRRAEQILGYGIGNKQGKREYPVIDGVIYTDLFEGEIELPFKFRLAFNGVQGRTDYYNEIIPTTKCRKSVIVEANWGSTEFNEEIADLLDWLEGNPSLDGIDSVGTRSLRIKDTSETFATAQEQKEGIDSILNSGFGFYIRRPLIISFGEQPDAARYF